MTERKTKLELKKIEAVFKQGFILEALLKNYHLNVELIKFIYSKTDIKESDKEKKIKAIISNISKEIDNNPKLKTIISKTNLKIIKVWSQKMETFFKTLKHKSPSNAKALFAETQKISGILNISAHKIFAHK